MHPLPVRSRRPTARTWPSRSARLEKPRAHGRGGVPNGFETSILTTRMRQQEYLDLAVLYQQDLAKIGIRARIEDVELAQYEHRT